MTDRELMQQALNALEWNLPVLEDYGGKEQLKRQHKAITALRDSLAQPEQELVIDCPRCGHCCPQQTWVGLTDEEIAGEFYKFEAASAWYQFARAIEAKLRDKNL